MKRRDFLKICGVILMLPITPLYTVQANVPRKRGISVPTRIGRDPFIPKIYRLYLPRIDAQD
jgi:hypothetical protein